MWGHAFRWMSVALMLIGLVAVLVVLGRFLSPDRLPDWVPAWAVRGPLMGACIVGGPYLVRWAWRKMAASPSAPAQ